MNLEKLLSLALWLAGLGHFVVLVASVQVPKYFDWKTQIPKLDSKNQKMFYTYAYYTFGTILFFGVATLVLHDEFLNGNRAALILAGFIMLFWLARVLTDVFSFGHKDHWPRGRFFVFGHILLTSLFVCLILAYSLVFVYHFFFQKH